LHYAILMPYLGCFFGLFGLMFAFIARRGGIVAAYAAAPFVWVVLDYTRSHFFWLALPWGMLAHSQYQCPTLIQTAAFTGAYGITFLVIAANAVIALALLTLLRRRVEVTGSEPKNPFDHRVTAIVLVAAFMVAGNMLYGRAMLSKPIQGPEIKIALVQGNIPQDKKWDKQYARFIMQTYADLTMEASQQGPALVAWPETATPVAINLDQATLFRVFKIVQKAQVPLLLGSAQRRKYEDETINGLDYTNAAFLIKPGQKLKDIQRYDKIHLLPFGEYLPAKDSIPWRAIGVEAVRGYTPGREFTVLDLSPHRFSAPICWENVFPYVPRNFVKNGAQFIINITNAAYFGRTAAPYQVVSMNVFRAVENRVYVARAANVGISCIIDPYGRVVDRVRADNGDDIFVRGYLIGTIKPQTKKTFYTMHGDVFAWTCLSVSVAFLITALFRRLSNKNENES
jgi:apolipoprotein N-acyltransferase